MDFAVAFVIAVAHSGIIPRNAYAATKPEGDSPTPSVWPNS
jgi:hypothetical protein